MNEPQPHHYKLLTSIVSLEEDFYIDLLDEDSLIKVAEYMTRLPKRKLMAEKLQKASLIAENKITKF